jgi:magnesium chelatase subunit D
MALLLNAVNPAIGGVLVRGEKGTAKSTAVRGLAALLPDVAVVAGCRFSCDPERPDPGCPDGPHDRPETLWRPARLVELPVGASEDRVAGSLDLEQALVAGRRAFEPGLLAQAHRGVLYVDEVNLLGDHLVDLLLDAAAMGTNHVEREGVSLRHAARFQLVGTMNPEEGELRPQLLDRFGLTVEVRASRELAERAEVVRRRLAHEADPAGFAAAWAAADAALAARIAAARKLLPEVELGESALQAVVAACAAFEVDGLRADVVTAKAASAFAAWDARTAVTLDDVRAAALLALPHRRRRGPFESPGLDEQRLDDALSGLDDDDPGGGGAPRPDRPPPNPAGVSGVPDSVPPTTEPGQAAGETTLPMGAMFEPVLLQAAGTGVGTAGRRSPAAGESGRHTSDRRPRGRVRDLAVGATVRAAAPAQAARGRAIRGGGGLILRPGDLREKVRVGREANLVLFVVDASGSMAARRRMSAVKGAVLSLLRDAYQRRDRIGVVTFRGEGAELALPPTASVELAGRLLADLPTGGRTPMAVGLERAGTVVAAERVRDPRRRPLLVLLTDGRATSGGGIPAAEWAAATLAAREIPGIVIDTEDAAVRLGLAERVAVALRAPCIRLEQLAIGPLIGAVRAVTGGARSVA